MSFLPSTLTIDVEPSSAQEITHFTSEQTCSDLRTKLVVLKYYPQQGSISLTPEGSQHSFSAKIEVEIYSLEAVGLAYLQMKSDWNNCSQNRPDLIISFIRFHVPKTWRNDLSVAASLVWYAVSTAWNSLSNLTIPVQHNIPVICNNTEFLRILEKYLQEVNPCSFLFRDWIPM